ncbi:dehydrogenase/reductase SDR family protein 7-like [Ciona intestinalis]
MIFELITLILVTTLVLYWLKQRKRKSLNGKVVLITGASSGVGKSCAFEFYARGAKVLLCSRNCEKLEAVKKELVNVRRNCPNPEVHKLDISDFETVDLRVQNIVKNSGDRVDVLVNNAGVGYRGRIDSTSVHVFHEIMKTNFTGQVAITKAVLPFMKENGGTVVGIGSVQAKISVPFRAPYSAAKHAGQAFYDCLRSEMHKDNINVLVVNPGHVNTNLSLNALQGDGSVYGKIDEATAKGLDPDYLAQQIVDAVELGKTEITPAPFHHIIAIWIRLICPKLYFWIMKKRAK